MVSLNDLDAQLAALGGSGSDSADESGDSDSTSSVSDARTRAAREVAAAAKNSSAPKAKAKAKKKKAKGQKVPKRKVQEDRLPSDGESAHEGRTHKIEQAATKQPNQETTALPPAKKRRRKGLCWKYLSGECKFDDCVFNHLKPEDLSLEERSQVILELPRRPFDPKLAEAIKKMNIPKCKDFHQRGGCKKPPGKCHFWHLSDGAIARWAGFEGWCEVCKRPLVSEKQLLEHRESKAHREAVAECRARGEDPDNMVKAAGRGSGRGFSGRGCAGGRGRGTGSGRGYR